ncbi:MAG: radical SAM protein [Candidatus Muiribacteriota bacterium]
MGIIQVETEKNFFESFNGGYASISISPENTWHKKIISPFFNIKENIKFNFTIPEGKFLTVIDFYHNNGKHYNFYENKLHNSDVTEILLKKNNMSMLDITGIFNKKGCLCPFLNPVISADKKITVCCNDSFYELCLNSDNNKIVNISDFWINNSKVRKLRYYNYTGFFADVDICRVCLDNKSIPLDTELAAEYAEFDFLFKGLDKLYQARIAGKKIIKYLMAELTDKCNLKCNFCNQKFEDWESVHNIKNKGEMNFEKFRDFLIKFKNNGYFFENIHLFWLGEPLLNSEFEKFINLLENEKNMFSKVEIHTNATLLDEKIIKLFEKLNFELKIHYSIDSVNAETYLKIKGSNFFETVVGNIKNSILKTKHKKNIIHVVQFVVNQINFKQAQDFGDYWEGFFNKNELDFQITSYFDFNRNRVIYFRQEDSIENNNNHSKNLHSTVRKNIVHKGNENYVDFYQNIKKEKKVKKFCSSPFEFLVIRYDGNITFCCHDTNMETGDFNIFENSVENFESYLKSFFSEFFKNKIEKCSNCIMTESENTHSIFLEQALFFLNSMKIDCKKLLEEELFD